MQNKHLATLVKAFLLLAPIIALSIPQFSNALPPGSYYGQHDSITLDMLGCNAADNVPVPGSRTLFLSRDYFAPGGTPLSRTSLCGSPEAKEANIANRWGIVLSEIDWKNRQFLLLKPLITTPHALSAGPFKGATLMAAYDPDIVVYRNRYIVSFECWFGPTGRAYGIYGTSACLAIYDPATQTIDPNSISVAVSGENRSGFFYSASVPHLIVWQNRLFIYYSAVAVQPSTQNFSHVAVRGVELVPDDRGYYWAKGAKTFAYTIEPPTVEVWRTANSDRMSNSAVDLKSAWTRDGNIYMIAALGGSGCTKPGPQPGCWRMSVAKSSQPLGTDIFNNSPALDQTLLPTNSQGYTRPIRNPDGQCWLLGDFVKPWVNGFSELRPVPSDWNAKPGAATLTAFPFDEALCSLN